MPELMPFSHRFLVICLLIAALLIAAAAAVDRLAVCPTDYLWACRWVAAALDNAVAVLFVGVFGATLSDLVLRFYVVGEDQ